MTALPSFSNNFETDLKKLKVLLIILTLIQVGYLIVVFSDAKLWMKLDIDYKANWIICGLHWVVSGIFIWFNWEKMPIVKKSKTKNTFLIILLGIIGMWLWIPNKDEVNKLSKK